MGSLFGSCGDKFVTWTVDTNELTGDSTVTFLSADETETLELKLNALTGASIAGEPVEVEDCKLVLPTDLFGSGEVSVDGSTYTITFPGQAPAVIPLGQSTTTPSADGSIHTITTADDVATDVCTDPVKTVLDNRDGTFTANRQSGATEVIDYSGTITDPAADGTVDITMPNGQTATVPTGAIPADVFITGWESVPTTNPDGSVTYTVSAMLSDGSTLPDVAITDTDTFGTVDSTAGVITDAAGNSVDICAHVGTNCNATTTVNDDGSVTHTDNAGVALTIPALRDECDQPLAQRSRLVAYDAGLVQLPTIACPDDCVPADPECPTGFYSQPDEFGGVWEWVGSGPWVRARKATCAVSDWGRVLSEDITSETDNGSVMVTEVIEFVNPTCDAMRFHVDIRPHGEIRGPGWAGAGVAFIGFDVVFDDVGVLHHTGGLYGGGGPIGNEELYLDHQGLSLFQNRLHPLVPAKSTVTKEVSIVVRKNLYTDPDNKMVAPYISWQINGQVECS